MRDDECIISEGCGCDVVNTDNVYYQKDEDTHGLNKLKKY